MTRNHPSDDFLADMLDDYMATEDCDFYVDHFSCVVGFDLDVNSKDKIEKCESMYYNLNLKCRSNFNCFLWSIKV